MAFGARQQEKTNPLCSAVLKVPHRANIAKLPGCRPGCNGVLQPSRLRDYQSSDETTPSLSPTQE
jgi:hypothetical protein